MAPPRAREFVLTHLDAFDDEALRVFLGPGDAAVDARLLGMAAQGIDGHLVERIAAALPAARVADFRAAHRTATPPSSVAEARRAVIARLFWPLLYWHDPVAYEELVAGEQIHPQILAGVGVEGRTVCDVGAGAGRFTMFAAATAARVIAVDEVPALLRRLSEHVRARGFTNVEVRRGSFSDLPLEEGAVDVAVSCSAVTSRAPGGGEPALAELERIVRPGGRVAVIWPDRPEWFVERGFVHVRAEGDGSLRFPDLASAERLCRDFYSEAAASWVVAHRSSAVPYAVLGVRPPNDMCVRDLPG